MDPGLIILMWFFCLLEKMYLSKYKDFNILSKIGLGKREGLIAISALNSYQMYDGDTQ